ncbi:hypothetical protein K502DRAFT_325792 [Neoconidiobolus thromboides FSU 785]|nr:hypothetical protein K502DRAFT_325792 [Neoconidiobolus thromboides FSU 785]
MKLSNVFLFLSSIFAADFYTSVGDAMNANPNAAVETIEIKPRQEKATPFAVHKANPSSRQVSIPFIGIREDKTSSSQSVASIAIHGGFIELNSDNFANKLYSRLDNASFYNFNCSINGETSNKIRTDNCNKNVCCEKIENVINEKFNKSRCPDTIKENCIKKQICHPNAMHVTATVFNTTKLSNLIRSKFIVSWHGFAERGDIQVIVGGRYKNVQKVAGDIQNSIGNNEKVVYCKNQDNVPSCHYVNNDIVVNGVSDLAGIHEKNVANRNGGGIHIELSKSYRDRNRYGNENLINAIIANLPI